MIVTSPGSPLRAADGLDGLRTALSAGNIRRFAIANPEHAPYGRAAEQALRATGLWDPLRSHLVLGENVSQAMQFATTAGAYSLALAPATRNRVSYSLLPDDLHDPLRQRMVLTRRATAEAALFFDYLMGTPAREVMRRHGFVLPGE